MWLNLLCQKINFIRSGKNGIHQIVLMVNGYQSLVVHREASSVMISHITQRLTHFFFLQNHSLVKNYDAIFVCVCMIAAVVVLLWYQNVFYHVPWVHTPHNDSLSLSRFTNITFENCMFVVFLPSKKNRWGIQSVDGRLRDSSINEKCRLHMRYAFLCARQIVYINAVNLSFVIDYSSSTLEHCI